MNHTRLSFHLVPAYTIITLLTMTGPGWSIDTTGLTIFQPYRHTLDDDILW